jgi:hypothetical protein
MGKIIKKSVDKVILNKEKFSLWMKWEFKIEFSNDSFGPYTFKFQREDCYFIDWLEDRWSSVFPIKNKAFKNTEIFLETNDIIIAVWERWSLLGWDKEFIDIINIKTEKKYRLFTDEVNLIYNTEKEIVLNALDDWKFKTIILDIDSLEEKEEKKEQLQAFFKSVYNVTKKKWYLLDFSIWDKNEKDEEEKYKIWFFNLVETQLSGIPKEFDRKKFIVKTSNWEIDVWKESIK